MRRYKTENLASASYAASFKGSSTMKIDMVNPILPNSPSTCTRFVFSGSSDRPYFTYSQYREF